MLVWEKIKQRAILPALIQMNREERAERKSKTQKKESL
jgi:hypothetical protein